MFGRNPRVARIAGIPVGISPWRLVIVAFLMWSLGSGYFQQRVPELAPVAAFALALASVLAIFAGILAHEFGHALVSRTPMRSPRTTTSPRFPSSTTMAWRWDG